MMNGQSLTGETHHITITMEIVIPDGAYFPNIEPLTKQEREFATKPWDCPSAEFVAWLRHNTEALGIDIGYIALGDAYTLRKITEVIQ